MNRRLLLLLAGEILLGLALAVLAIAVRIILGSGGSHTLFVAVLFIFQLSYLANAAGAVVSLWLFLGASEDDLPLPAIVGHLLNWIYVVGLSWVFGWLLLAAPFGSSD
jgi:hypothetical protein